MARDAEAAVALLEAKVKHRDAEVMRMLGVCCEFGIRTEQDVERAEQLCKRSGARKHNSNAADGQAEEQEWVRLCKNGLGMSGRESRSTNTEQQFCETTVVVDRKLMRRRGFQSVGFDDVVIHVAHNTEPQM